MPWGPGASANFKSTLALLKNMLAGRLKCWWKKVFSDAAALRTVARGRSTCLLRSGLQTVLVALAQWADEYLLTPDEPATVLIDNLTRQPRKLVLQSPMAGRSAPTTLPPDCQLTD